MAKSGAVQSEHHESRRQPGSEEVKAALDRVLTSRCFEQAGCSSDFLRFVVEQALDGNSDRLKGYTIAVEVFARPHDFDAQSDPLVRVEAGRLRRRLIEYYASEGADEPVRIEIERGNYAPKFSYRQAPETGDKPPPHRSKARWRRLRTLLIVTVLLAGLIVAALESLRRRSVTTPPTFAASLTLPRGPRVLVMPFEDLSGDPNLAYLADGITEEIILRLGEFDLFLIASETSRQYRGSARPPAAAAADVNAGYVLAGSVRSTPGGTPETRSNEHARLLAPRSTSRAPAISPTWPSPGPDSSAVICPASSAALRACSR